MSHLMKILFLDSQINAKREMLRGLEKKGVTFLFAEKPKDAFKLLENHRTEVQLAILSREVKGDAKEKETGLTFLEKLKSNPQYSELPVILTTQSWSESQCAEHQRGPHGANAYLQAPYSQEQLTDLIEGVLGQAWVTQLGKPDSRVSGEAQDSFQMPVLEDASQIFKKDLGGNSAGLSINLETFDLGPALDSPERPEKSAKLKAPAKAPAEAAPEHSQSHSAVSLGIPSPSESSGLSLELNSMGVESAQSLAASSAKDSSSLSSSTSSVPEIDIALDQSFDPQLDQVRPPSPSFSTPIEELEKKEIQIPQQSSTTDSVAPGALDLPSFQSQQSSPVREGASEGLSFSISGDEVPLPQGPESPSLPSSGAAQLASEVDPTRLNSSFALESNPDLAPALRSAGDLQESFSEQGLLARGSGADWGSLESSMDSPEGSSHEAFEDRQVAQEMPYLLQGYRKESSATPPPPFFFSEPLGDAVVPGGAAQSPDLETVKKYLLLREQDVAVLSGQLKLSQDQLAELNQQLKQSKSKESELSFTVSEQKKRIDEFEKEKASALEQLRAEMDESAFQLKAKTDRARILERQAKQAIDDLERFKERVRTDIRKIRVREKELENRLEMSKKDAEALIAARDQKIIELKRKLDVLEFNMDLLQQQCNREKENATKLRERLTKAFQVVRVAGGLLDSSQEGKAEVGLKDSSFGVQGEENSEKAS
ncbi:MAG: hypothetical protein ACO3A2_00760 [Bdellovibrionia bacterium]